MSTAAWEALRGRLSGELTRPADAGYDTARQLQIVEYDRVRPDAIAFCASTADVQACLTFAAEQGISVAPRSGRHNFAGWSTTEGLVVDTSRIDHVRGGGATVGLGPGALAVEVVAALHQHGQQVVTGICPTVCMGGYLLGGGIGWQTRSSGPASDHVVSVDLVTADGQAVRASADENADLFWALRGGGGGNFGIVTGFEVRPVSVPSMTNFTLSWSWEHALDLLERWQHWSSAGSRPLSSEIGALLVDAAPGAEPAVFMHGAYLGSQAEADAALDELCQVAAPQLRLVGELPYEQAMYQLYRVEGMSPRQRRRAGDNPEAALPRQPFQRERHRLFTEPMGRHSLGEALEVFEQNRRAGQFRYFALMSLGGAANDVSSTETAYVHRDAQFLGKFALGGQNPDFDYDEEYVRAAEEWVGAGFSVLDPLSNGHSYVNYPDPALRDWQWSYYGENHARLAEVKKAWDPAGLFSFPQGVSA
ncbi:FAD-binding oxidoreductase [Lentzea sp.]|uniref:FAD-binding oxidoreductase n=1 Tax=Lentzea sp. TaxID=56099 RepID=UPI002B694B25|nr:FAD-binding oxidoreductase [Lentzea sp.]HUQ54783.1 FAD-binding oxidoreductase [Lentzea sp.]